MYAELIKLPSKCFMNATTCESSVDRTDAERDQRKRRRNTLGVPLKNDKINRITAHLHLPLAGLMMFTRHLGQRSRQSEGNETVV